MMKPEWQEEHIKQVFDRFLDELQKNRLEPYGVDLKSAYDLGAISLEVHFSFSGEDMSLYFDPEGSVLPKINLDEEDEEILKQVFLESIANEPHITSLVAVMIQKIGLVYGFPSNLNVNFQAELGQTNSEITGFISLGLEA